MQFTLLLIASLWSILQSPIFYFLFLIFLPKTTTREQRGSPGYKIWPFFFCACMYVHWTSPLVTERAARGCYVAEVHHSHLPVCQMSCLAELHTVMVLTKWQEGGTLQWMSIWLQSTASPGALKLPHTKTERREREPWFIKGKPHRIGYLHKTYGVTCMRNDVRYAIPALLLHVHDVNTLWLKSYPRCN